MLKKTVIFMIFIVVIMTGCIDKKDEEEITKVSKFDKMILEIKEYKKNMNKAVTISVQDGLYVKNGTYYNFYSYNKLGILTFEEKIALLEKVELSPTTVFVVVSDFTKSFYDYISLDDLLIKGINATTKIGMTTTIYDIENGKYAFATGNGINTPVIGTGGGTFTTQQTVVLSCSTSGVKIRYTTDGTEPTTSSTEYTAGIVVSSNKTVKAKAFSADGLIVSKTATATYIINTATSTTGIMYAGKTYSGKLEVGSGNPLNYTSNYVKITEPAVACFSADGYFNIKGCNAATGASRYILVYINKVGTEYSTDYFFEGNFDGKIWLRFGAGKYEAHVYIINLKDANTISTYGDGDIISYSYSPYPIYSFEIINTRDEDGKFTYPSNFIQSDDAKILTKANEILSTACVKSGTIEQKAKAIHDYILENVHYDYSSLSAGKRKKQDALTVLNTGLAVCEGYTSLYTALFRAVGVPTKAVYGYGGGGLHAWNNVLAENGNWYFVDTTWDDVEWTNSDGTITEYHLEDYFWLTGNTGIDNDHYLIDERNYRSVSTGNYNKNGIIRNGVEGSY